MTSHDGQPVLSRKCSHKVSSVSSSLQAVMRCFLHVIVWRQQRRKTRTAVSFSTGYVYSVLPLLMDDAALVLSFK